MLLVTALRPVWRSAAVSVEEQVSASKLRAREDRRKRLDSLMTITGCCDMLRDS